MAANNSSCDNTTSYQIYTLGSLGAVSVATCLVALCWVFYLKLHRQFLYRLATYQVMGSLLHATFLACQFAFLEYDSSKYPSCVALAYLIQVSGWMKACFGCWITFHLFCFAVLLKNMKKLEPLYVISSVLFSIVISSVPLITKSYGPNGNWCWIQTEKCNNKDETGIIEQVGVWYGPAFVALVLQLIAILWMMITVYYRGHRKSDQNTFGHEQNKKAFKQLLPLVSYPLLFIIFIIPPLVDRVYGFFGSPPMALRFIYAIFVPLWSFSAGLTLIIHIGTMKCDNILGKVMSLDRKNDQVVDARGVQNSNELLAEGDSCRLLTVTRNDQTRSSTYFSVNHESDFDRYPED